MDAHPVTPDGRYFVVRGRLWRRTNPDLPEERVRELTEELMRTRRKLRKGVGTMDERAEARGVVNAAKVALGERGPAWWTDGAPDFNRKMAKNTPYRSWFEGLAGASDPSGG